MTLQELNNGLTKLLKDYIKSQHHIKTGHLYNSIRFVCTFKSDYLDLNFESLDYIWEIDGGNFINKFFLLDSVQNMIADFLDTSYEAEIEKKIINSNL